MEETVIVIMLIDEESGFLDKELGSYKISENESLIYNTFAFKKNDEIVVAMKITTEREVEDWEFDAIYDYYDNETISPFVTSIEEEEDCYNPTWKITFDFDENVQVMEEKIKNILRLHNQELMSVYDVIKDKRDDY